MKEINLKKFGNIRLGLSEDGFKTILINNKPLSHLISWEIKKKLVDKVNNKIEQDIEYIFIRCNKISNDKKAAFFLSVGGYDWVRKDSWNSPALDEYLQKQLSFYFDMSDVNSVKLFDNISKKNLTAKKIIKNFLKKNFLFFDIFFSSFIFSLINTIKKKIFYKITTMSFVGERINSSQITNSPNDKIFNIDNTFQVKIKNFSKFFFKNKPTVYDYISIIDWLGALKVSIKYFFIWKKFLINTKKNKRFFNKINNSFAGIFYSVFHYRAVSKYIDATKPKFILHGGPNNPSARRVFLAGSELGVCTVSIYGKVMVRSNMGYRFNKIRMKCDQIGIADKFFVNTISARNVLLQNGVKESDIKVTDKQIKKKEILNKKLIQKNFILICLTNREKVNSEIYQYIRKYIDDPNILLLVRAHPLYSLIKQSLFSSSKEFIDVSTLTFEEINNIYCDGNIKFLAVSNYSSALCKALGFGFIPIWLRNLGDSPILFSEIIENTGESVNTPIEFHNLVNKYFQNINFENHKETTKIKSNIYIETILNDQHINEYISSLKN